MLYYAIYACYISEGVLSWCIETLRYIEQARYRVGIGYWLWVVYVYVVEIAGQCSTVPGQAQGPMDIYRHYDPRHRERMRRQREQRIRRCHHHSPLGAMDGRRGR